MSSNKSITRYLSVFIIVLALFGLSTYSFGVFGQGGKAEFKDEYKESIQSNNLYKYITQYDVLELLNDGTGVLYLGYPEDVECKRIVSVLNETAFTNGIDKIVLSLNEMNKVEVENQSTNFYNELLKELKDNTDEYILEDENGKIYKTGKMKLNTPSVVFIKDGEIVYFHDGIVEGYNDVNVDLTQEQLDELERIYQMGFDLINEYKRGK